MPTAELALRRFDEEKQGTGIFGGSEQAYREIVRHFVTSGSTVANHHVQSVHPSPFALPSEIMDQIKGETTMGWTGWVFEMTDGSVFSYGSTFSFDFFELPEGYNFSNVARVHNHSQVNSDGKVVSIDKDRGNFAPNHFADGQARVYREKPYFICFADSGPHVD